MCTMEEKISMVGILNAYGILKNAGHVQVCMSKVLSKYYYCVRLQCAMTDWQMIYTVRDIHSTREDS